MMTNTVDLGTVMARTSVTLQVMHYNAGKPAHGKHDCIQAGLRFVAEVGVDDIGCDVTTLPQKPCGGKKHDPKEGILGGLHYPYSRLFKEIPHADGVADSANDEDKYYSSQGCH